MVNPFKVAIVKYEKPQDSVRKAVELSRGLDHLPSKTNVIIKPNIVNWTMATPFPKFGVITTSRIIEDMVILLKERGIDDITIAEGSVMADPKDVETAQHAFKTLGYGVLNKRYGVRSVNIFERPFKKVDLGDGVVVRINEDILNAGFVVDLPVLKTHSQTVVSLGIKNLKGMIDIPSRKKCHNTTPGKDLHFWVSKLADPMPPTFTLLDGIYTNERGPSIDGRMRRSNILVASADILAADMVGAKVLGFETSDVPHLVHAAKHRNRPIDLSDVEVVGETIESVASPHEWTFPYTEDNSLPLPMEKKGIKGVSYRKFDLSLCTYCSGMTGVVLSSIAFAWKGEPWDDVEVLTGKSMAPTPGKNKTILLGKCMYQANKDHPDINEMIAVKGCPPKPNTVVKALHRAGIEVDPSIYENIDKLPGFYLKRYADKPEFDDAFFKIE
ncbi:MAG: DUF362 domain-containing protein [Desulfobacterales bacterium]